MVAKVREEISWRAPYDVVGPGLALKFYGYVLVSEGKRDDLALPYLVYYRARAPCINRFFYPSFHEALKFYGEG